MTINPVQPIPLPALQAVHQVPTLTTDILTGRAVIAVPVGAIVTDAGHTFAVEPLDVTTLPVRVRCTSCPWQATTPGLDPAVAEATRHAAAHLHHDQQTGGAR